MTLATLRKQKRMTQQSLGCKVGVSQRAIANYEAGTRRPSPTIAQRIANVLGLSLAEMWVMFYAKDAG